MYIYTPTYPIIDIFVDFLKLPHSLSVNVQYLESTILVRKTNLHLHLESSRSHQRFVNHILTIRHTDDKDIIQLFNTYYKKKFV